MSNVNIKNLVRAVALNQKLTTELKDNLPENKELRISIQDLLDRSPSLNLQEELNRHNRTMARAIVVASGVALSQREYSLLFGESVLMQTEKGAALESTQVCRECAHTLLTDANVRKPSGKEVDVNRLLDSFRVRYFPIMLPELEIDGLPDNPKADRLFISRRKSRKACLQCVEVQVDQLGLLELDS